MRYFAAHRAWIASSDRLLSMCRIGITDTTHRVLSVETFESETEQTEWIGGLILVAPLCPERLSQETFAEYRQRMISELESVDGTHSTPLSAYHFVPFNVTDMEFLPSTRIVRL